MPKTQRIGNQNCIRNVIFKSYMLCNLHQVITFSKLKANKVHILQIRKFFEEEKVFKEVRGFVVCRKPKTETKYSVEHFSECDCDMFHAEFDVHTEKLFLESQSKCRQIGTKQLKREEKWGKKILPQNITQSSLQYKKLSSTIRKKIL